MNKFRTKKTVAIDFDGVIHKYSRGYQDGSIYDEPIEGAFDFIRKLMDGGYSVYVHSTRSPWKIRRWLIENSFATEYDVVGVKGMGGDPTNRKYPKYGFTVSVIPFWKKFWNKENILGVSRRKIPAVAYLDDRAVRFSGDFVSAEKEIKNL